MSYNFTGDVSFKEKLIQVLEKNELDGLSPYELHWAGTSGSGWSFGIVQYDIAALEFSRNLFMDVLLNAKDLNGNYIIQDGELSTGRYHLDALTGDVIIDDTKVADFFEKAQSTGGVGLTETERTLINSALQSSYGVEKIDGSYNTYFDMELFPSKVDPILSVATGADFEFLQTDIGKIFIIDFSNQYGLQNIRLLKNFVSGQVITTQMGWVIQKQDVLGVDDLLNFYFRTSNANNLPWDPIRRFANIVAVTGYSPTDLTEAKGVLRAYTFIYVPNEERFLEINARVNALNLFRDLVTKPAETLVLGWIWETYGIDVPPSGYDDILVGDEKNNKSNIGEYQLNGRDGNDVIFGEGGNDVIEGGKGNDIIIGGMGNDFLKGGVGFDIYLYGTGDGRDTIYDSDGQGEIRWDSNLLTGGKWLAGTQDGNGGIFLSDDGRFQYTYIRGVGPIFDSLTITRVDIARSPGEEGSDSLIIQDFQSVELGIILNDIIPEWTFQNLYQGDTDPENFNDTLSGGAFNDRILGFTGNDIALGQEGDDEIVGGQGDDDLDGNAGNDRLYGEDDNDILNGGAGMDQQAAA